MEKNISVTLTEEQVNLLSKILNVLDFNADDYNNLCGIRQALTKKEYNRWVILKDYLPPELIKKWSYANKTFDHDTDLLLGDINEDWIKISSRVLDIISAWSKGDYCIPHSDLGSDDLDKVLMAWRDDCLALEKKGYVPVPVTHGQMIEDIAECC